MAELKPYVLVRFSKKTGKIDTSLESLGCALLELWAVQNTTKTKATLVFAKDDGEVVYKCEGAEGFPDVERDNLGNIEEYCPGLLEAVNE